MNLDAIILAELQRGGPPLWVSGRTYPKGWEVRSPANLQRYVRKVAGAGAADPSADTDNWEPWSKTVDATLAALGSSVANVKAVADALSVTLANVKATVEGLSAAPKSIKSVQRGVSEVTPGKESILVTITPVNMAKAYLNLLTVPVDQSGIQGGDVKLNFVNENTIQVTGYYVTGGGYWAGRRVSWEVIEGY